MYIYQQADVCRGTCSSIIRNVGMSVLMLRGRNKCRGHFFPMVQQPLLDQDLLIIEASLSHSDTPQPVELLWTSDKPHAETATWQHTALTRDISMKPAGVEPTIPANERPLESAIVVDVLDSRRWFYTRVCESFEHVAKIFRSKIFRQGIADKTETHNFMC